MIKWIIICIALIFVSCIIYAAYCIGNILNKADKHERMMSDPMNLGFEPPEEGE